MNPYGITQVNVPGLLEVYTGAQQARTAQERLRLQIAAAEQEVEQRRGIQAAMARYAGGGAPSMPGVAMPGGAMPAADAATSPGAPATPAAPAAPAPGHGDMDQLFRDLLVINPEVAFNTARAVQQMDAATAQATARMNTTLGRAAQALLQLPEAERPAAFAAMRDHLVQQGIRPERIDGFQLNQQNLTSVLNEARDLEKIIEASRPDVMEFDGFLIDRRNPTEPIVQSPRSRMVTGRNGEVWEETPVAGIPTLGGVAPQTAPAGDIVAVATPEEARRLPPGTRFRIPDGRIGTVPPRDGQGGASQPGSHTFPDPQQYPPGQW